MREIKTDLAPKAIGPYSQGIICKDFIYFSGQIPLKDGILVDDYKEATEIIMNNISNILKSAKSDLSNLIKVTIFIKDISYFNVVNEAYETFLTKPYPARSVVEVSNLPKGAILEIEGVAKL